MIQALAEFSKHNASHVKGILNLTIPLSESPVWILGQYLWQLGLSTNSRRPMEDGQVFGIIGSILLMSSLARRYWIIGRGNGKTGKENATRSRNFRRLMRLGCSLNMVLSMGAEERRWRGEN
ncbi:hypothetical protein A6769_30180 [Nostoc punctiforme NIES-2108]|uniref:Uncharacterized protein n=1 Tax=Nostoc punctiforme NIES-2108 TaxID=1356359 RepID=A0A367R5S6_NOSPU|nr:hypothetical protein A6769_30180 [Nostoc punctiforme NIES-2108]